VPNSSSRMGSNRSQIGTLKVVTGLGFAGPFKKGKKSPKKIMPKMTTKGSKKAH
jgi:hypothetical protein